MLLKIIYLTDFRIFRPTFRPSCHFLSVRPIA